MALKLLLEALMGIAEGMTAACIGNSSPGPGEPIEIYKGYPEKCHGCDSLDISLSGGWEDGNVKTEEVYCNKCGYRNSYSIT